MVDQKETLKEIRSAIKNGDMGKVIELLEDNADMLNMVTPFGTWLHVAASHGQLAIVKKLVELGVPIDTRGGTYEGGALNDAASKGYIEIVEYLLACGAEMDVSDPVRNPLFGAITNGNPEMAELLLKSGIDASVRYTGDSMREMDARAFAREQGQPAIVTLLEKYVGTTPTAAGDQRHNPHHEIVELMTNVFGDVRQTISEIIPASTVSVNVHLIPPSKDKNFITLFTTVDPNDGGYAELIMKLPAGWVLNRDATDGDYWPLKWLRKTAHLPRMDEGVILPNGEPPQPFAANTTLSCVMICSPSEAELTSAERRNLNVYTLLPIYEEERRLALEKGYPYLLGKLKENGISDVLDPQRINVGIE